MFVMLLFSLCIPLNGNLGTQSSTSKSNESQIEIESEQTFGKEGEESAFDFVQTNDGYLLLAGVTENENNRKFMLLKLNTSLELEWNKTIGGYGDDYVCISGCDLIQTKDGGYAIGSETIENTTGVNDINMWLIKTDSNGDVIWNQTYGDSNTQLGNSLIQTNDGGYILAGANKNNQTDDLDGFLVKTDSQGYQQWNKTFGGWNEEQIISIIQTSDGGYALELLTCSFGSGESEFWLIKLDSEGIVEWDQTFGTRSWEYAGSIIQTTDEGYVLVGGSYGLNKGDIVFIKTNSLGIMEWYKTYGTETYEEVAYSVIQSSDGGYAVLGFTTRKNLYKDALILKLDTSGNQKWNKTFGGLLEDYSVEFIETKEGDFIFFGVTKSIGSAIGHQDLWLVKTKFVKSDTGSLIPSFSLAIAVVSFAIILRMKNFRRR